MPATVVDVHRNGTVPVLEEGIDDGELRPAEPIVEALTEPPRAETGATP